MSSIGRRIVSFDLLARTFVPFADAGTTELPLGRLFRLSLFQISVGITMVLLGGTLNRVMAVELGIPVSVIAVALALPLVAAPARTLIGFKSDTHRSYLGWRRVPFMWFGSLVQFGGLSVMPFSLLLLSDGPPGTTLYGEAGMTLAFLMVGFGLHTTQTAGLALATDLAPEEKRPRVVAMLYTMLLVGMVGGAIVIGRLLQDFSTLRLIQVLQGSALVTIALTGIAMWKQEPRRRDIAPSGEARPRFREAFAAFRRQQDLTRLLSALAVGSAAFGMQDILLEPYGGSVLHMRVGSTTLLTALFSAGSLLGYVFAARVLGKGGNPRVIAAIGLLVGIPGFMAVILSSPFQSVAVFCIGTATIGIGSGLFAVSMLISAMGLVTEGSGGLALGAWSAVQAMAIGLAVAIGGFIRDGVGGLVHSGWLGPAFGTPAAGYCVVYGVEIALVFAALAVLGPLIRPQKIQPRPAPARHFGLADLPN
ncbi:BCD family MFS transporter [Jiella sp. M17.18]|uniref:BCD family MFS transporter n=1 Tax=Jiella sp. M17.18 TaxID=3234247 RepID=UPI0034DFBDF8